MFASTTTPYIRPFAVHHNIYHAMMLIGRRRSQGRAGSRVAAMSAASGWRLSIRQSRDSTHLTTPLPYVTEVPEVSKESIIIPEVLA
ncbi:hypothetical protein PG987_000167 [Apiospora arundinis]